MKFHKNSLKLAGLYLAILMVISLFFSINLYQLSVQELERGLRRSPQSESIINSLSGNGNEFAQTLIQAREVQFREAKNHILQRLVIINLFILLGGGVLSYYFASRTLRPIEEAHEALERFTADASHELRTPIAAMRTETEVALMDSKLTLKKAKQILASNVEELGKLTDLSEGLLRLARAQNNQIQKTNVSLSKVIQKAVDRMLPLAEKKNILINIKSKNDVIVPAEAASLMEVLIIILDNAVKYSAPKSEVTVTLDQGSKQAIIKIADHGIGIKATELPHIFDRLYRADSARSKQNVGGYGLGLAIAKNIIDLHGGRIKAQSKPTQGTTFSIYLPKA